MIIGRNNIAGDQSGIYDVDGKSYSKLGLQDKDIDNDYHLIKN